MPEKKQIEKIVYKNEQERREALKRTMQEMNKKYGMSVIGYGSDEPEMLKVSFGVPEIDDLLGGGIKRGQFSCLWGAPASGKSTLAYNLTASAQKQGLSVFYIALEGFDVARAKQFGVDMEKVTVGHYPIAEESLDAIISLAKQKLVDVIILDSIQALAPKQEMEEKSGDTKSTENDTMALLARKLSQFFRMATDAVYRSNIAVLLIGQTRTSVGFIAMETLSGGNALRHSCKLIVHIRKGQKADSPQEKTKNEEGKTESKQIGFDCVLRIDKSQVTGTKPELTEIHVPYYFASGFSKEEPKVVTITHPVSTDFPEGIITSTEGEGVMDIKTGVITESEPKKKRGRPKKK